jgi:antitoxin component of RelBE/YafQ-DinJ toxin-antitoxin module
VPGLDGRCDADTFLTMSQTTTVFRARVPSERLKKAEKILGRPGLKPADALNLMLAQIELRQGLPFAVTGFLTENFPR